MRDPKFAAPEFPPLAVTCQGCGHELTEGETAWAADWIVITEAGPRREVRYTCDDCEVCT